MSTHPSCSTYPSARKTWHNYRQALPAALIAQNVLLLLRADVMQPVACEPMPHQSHASPCITCDVCLMASCVTRKQRLVCDS
jgi:hypothetical protein